MRLAPTGYDNLVAGRMTGQRTACGVTVGCAEANVIRVASPPAKPLLIFDGDCAFCRDWVSRWRARTGECVEYRPFQDPEISTRFPEVPPERSARSVQLVEPTGLVFEGAHAAFRLLALAGSPWPLRLYERIPVAAWISERTYRFVAGHRPLFSRLMGLWKRGG